jgi:hypothetical protein
LVTRGTTAGPNLNAMGCAARIGTRLGLLLLLLTAVSLITMPFTQHLWTWDRFLHGGQDFETSALLILTALNLVLVLAKCCKQNVGKLLTAWRRLAIEGIEKVSGRTCGGAVAAALNHRVSIPDLPAYHLPLLI